MLQTLKCPDSAGVLRVKLIKARNLVDRDLRGVSDPYAILTVGATSHRAATIQDNLNPKWNEHFDFPIEVSSGWMSVRSVNPHRLWMARN